MKDSEESVVLEPKADVSVKGIIKRSLTVSLVSAGLPKAQTQQG